jgi:uncharacterized protein YjbI with pentapeptide repeats
MHVESGQRGRATHIHNRSSPSRSTARTLNSDASATHWPLAVRGPRDPEVTGPGDEGTSAATDEAKKASSNVALTARIVCSIAREHAAAARPAGDGGAFERAVEDAARNLRRPMRTHTDRDVRLLVARSHGAPLDLSNADLEMANLPHVDLRGANLASANLRGAMLWGALLDGACLEGADLTCANLTWSSIRRCSMKGALLVEADLDEALVHDGLSDAITVGADMLTIMYTVSAMEQTRLAKRALPDEEDQRARDAALWTAHESTASSRLRARGAAGFSQKADELERARTRVLSDADLHDLLGWSKTTGSPLNLRGCNLSGANLRNASLRGACLAFTDVTGADARGVDLTGANLQDSCGWPGQRPWWKPW